MPKSLWHLGCLSSDDGTARLVSLRPPSGRPSPVQPQIPAGRRVATLAVWGFGQVSLAGLSDLGNFPRGTGRCLFEVGALPRG